MLNTIGMFSQYFKEMFGPEWQVYEAPRDIEPGLAYTLGRRICVNEAELKNNPLIVLDKFCDELHKSEFVNRIKKNYEAKYQKQELRIKEMETEIVRLRYYKTFYDAAFELIHGPTVNVLRTEESETNQ